MSLLEGNRSMGDCQICRVKGKKAKYVCSRCQLSYCSVNCFKSETHRSCSEDFYKKNVQEELKIPRGDDVDKLKLINTLHKFNDVQSEWKYESPTNIDEVEKTLDIDKDDLDKLQEEVFTQEDEEELIRLIESASPDELLRILTPEQRLRFEALLEQYDIEE